MVCGRLSLARESDDTLEQVRRKERTLQALTADDGPLARWKTAADLWCAGWFAERADGRILGTLVRDILDGRVSLPAHVSQPILQQARDAAGRGRYFHWTLEFPEIFYDADGAPLPAPGFDAVLGNPPWEMLRADRDGESPRTALTRFVRQSGIYPLQGSGHSNLYQLFVERALSLLRPAGRLGFIVPSGLGTDHGCAALRRELFERTAIDGYLTFENRDGVFPIHRGLKFVLLTATRSGSTPAVPVRTVRSTDVLDRLPDRGADPEAVHVPLPFIEQTGGTLPDVRSASDLEILSRIAGSFPALGDPGGWQLRFGRELNATDDCGHFTQDGRGLPIVEGKHLQPFQVHPGAAHYWISSAIAARLLRAPTPYVRPRLAYREVASATNRLTLIAAIVPAGVVTTHTVFCVKSPPDLRAQHYLCGIFNSFVANFFVRTRVGTHVTAAVIDRLPVPKPDPGANLFREIAALARRLSKITDQNASARLQALAAHAYGLSPAQFAHVLDSFPLVSRAERDAALAAFRCIVEPSTLTEIR
jgi:hypothetical protein